MKLYFVNSNNVKKNVNLVLFCFERFYCYVCIILKSFVTDLLEAAFCLIKQTDFCQKYQSISQCLYPGTKCKTFQNIQQRGRIIIIKKLIINESNDYYQ